MAARNTSTIRKPLKPQAKASPVTPAAALEGFSLLNDQLLTTSQAGSLIGLSAKSLRCMRCDRSGPRCLKLGAGKQARVVYRRSDLAKWVMSRVSAVQGS